MNKIKKPDLIKLENSVNPFVSVLEIKIKQLESKNTFVLDEGVILNQIYTIESTPKVFVYVKPEHRIIHNKLESCAKELLWWVLYSLETNKDYFWLNKDRYMKETKTSLNTYKKAIESLCKEGFIQATYIKDSFWINPEFFFRGDRKSKYPKNCVIDGALFTI
jgi:hypothetical protein